MIGEKLSMDKKMDGSECKEVMILMESKVSPKPLFRILYKSKKEMINGKN